ncbi:probable N-acetyltransferase HLS1 isoform X1 [Zingiber officinale]|nr:probable N-acetyltransferase HLS1 isoform X1 [Zingiber officinale]
MEVKGHMDIVTVASPEWVPAPGVVIREYDASRDRKGAEAVERLCDVGTSSGGMSLFTDLLGDPLCRVRHSPPFLMLVAELIGGPQKEIVGLVRGCIKTVACGATTKNLNHHPSLTVSISAKVAYLLGLRVSPHHRRRGIALNLVQRMEEWFKAKGADYAYMATEKDNEASLRLFTGRCGYSKFRTPAILVHPVFAHRLPLTPQIAVLRLPLADAEELYRRRFGATEFFPRDIDAVLANPLSLGTFLAVPSGCPAAARWPGAAAFLAAPPASWAVVSVWNSKEVFRMEVRGAGPWRRGLARASRAVDRALPWLRIPSVPDLFRPFGLYLVYGIYGEGPAAAEHARALCRHTHNMAMGDPECRVIAAEMAECDPLRPGIPFWSRLSCAEDVWCVKRLAEDYGDGALGDWTKAPPPPSIFVDPREF